MNTSATVVGESSDEHFASTDDAAVTAVQQNTGGPVQSGGASPAGYDQKALLATQMMAKRTGLAALLALLFGGFGLLYASIPLGIVFSVIEVVMRLVFFFTSGFGILLYIRWHIVCVVAALILVSGYNKRLLAKL